MTEYFFNENAPCRRTVITQSKLGAKELELINSVVNWDSPNKWNNWIFEVSGRSIFFRSPERRATLEDLLNDNFDGLQLIGAGGNTFFVQSGIVYLPEVVLIHPLNERNHAKLFEPITELREFNENGLIGFSNRKYVPLHGMDISEARNRRLFSERVDDVVRRHTTNVTRPPFIGPKLVAEGYFPENLDMYGNPLYFQVYRIPTIPRLPSQIIRILHETANFTKTIDFLLDASYVVGSTLRDFHSMGLAYMDGHCGNMNFIRSNGRSVLNVNDLGSMKDVIANLLNNGTFLA